MITDSDALRAMDIGDRFVLGQLLASLGRSAMEDYPTHADWGNGVTPQYDNVDETVLLINMMNWEIENGMDHLRINIGRDYERKMYNIPLFFSPKFSRTSQTKK